MDVAAMSIVLSQYKVQESAGIMVLKKAMTAARQDGDAIVSMAAAVEEMAAVDPYLGNNIDMYI